MYSRVQLKLIQCVKQNLTSFPFPVSPFSSIIYSLMIPVPALEHFLSQLFLFSADEIKMSMRVIKGSLHKTHTKTILQLVKWMCFLKLLSILVLKLSVLPLCLLPISRSF